MGGPLSTKVGERMAKVGERMTKVGERMTKVGERMTKVLKTYKCVQRPKKRQKLRCRQVYSVVCFSVPSRFSKYFYTVRHK